MTKKTLLVLALSILTVGAANAAILTEDFESYADTAALQATWNTTEGSLSSYTLETDSTNYMEINANLGTAPNYGVVSTNLSGADWTGADQLAIDYRGTSGKSREKLEIEILKASDWSQKWQSGAWDYLSDDTWYTKTIDTSSIPSAILSDIGPVRIVVKAGLDWGTTQVDVDNLQVVPEPTSLLLLGSGLVGLLGFSRKKRT